MCGFAGVIAFEDWFRVSRETLGRMSARIAHRGPDGEGLWLSHEAEVTPERPQAALAHRRLAILDPDPRPTSRSPTAGRWVVFNGEIYNFRELRAELDALRPDYAWRTAGDTEVLLLRLRRLGRAVRRPLQRHVRFRRVGRAQDHTLFLARDRMGQKPLYVAFAYASDHRSRGTPECDEPTTP